MYLKHLSLTNFRAFNRLDIELPRRVLLLIGDNAQGKTSLLEAIHYLATFSSFHTSSDRQLINFQATEDPLTVTRLVAEIEGKGGTHRLEVRLIQEIKNNEQGFRKEILYDGVKRKAYEAYGCFTAVLFLPQMTRMIEDGPEERRRYLNTVIAQADPLYARVLNEYSQALSQRNALLKLLGERGGDAGQLDFWDDILAKRGSVIIKARTATVSKLEVLAARTHHDLTNARGILRITYQPSYHPNINTNGQIPLPLHSMAQLGDLPVEEIQKGFIDRLTAMRGEEINRGVTLTGPHRDELRFLENGIDLGNFGSRGQVRTALMSLKLAEVSWLKEMTGDFPVLLLDEILAELDHQHRADLLDFIDSCDQVLLTTTDQALFPDEFIRKSIVGRVEAGRVSLEDASSG